MKGYQAILVVLIVLFIDQAVKIWIKTHLHMGEEFNIFGDWSRIHFTENKGMAFGMEMGGEYGKLFLSLFRIFAVFVLSYFLSGLIKRKASVITILSLSLILAGAIGNILDSVFYGVIFSESTNTQIATFLPEGGGYSSFLHGKVVDMLYFPLYSGFYPEWIPVIGGKYFSFFRPVFNIADSAISIGVFLLIVFQKSFFSDTASEKKSDLKETISE